MWLVDILLTLARILLFFIVLFSVTYYGIKALGKVKIKGKTLSKWSEMYTNEKILKIKKY